MWPIFIIVSKFLLSEDFPMEWSDGGNSRQFNLLLADLYSDKGLIKRLPVSHFVNVPHIRQLCNWDCGLACVLMVLRTLGINDCGIHDLEQFCGTKSVWTVDLAYLLKRFSIKFYFFTITLGANPDFSSEVFYKEQLFHDQGRVNTLFNKALEAGIYIEHRSLSGNDISLLILSGQYVAIALVDKYKLSYSCSEDTHPPELNRLPNYIGHFIVICGFDKETGEFDVRDSASFRKHERISLLCLDEARKSFGTDEDILLIPLNGEGQDIKRHN